MEKDLSPNLVTHETDPVIINATNYANEVARFLDEQFMEQFELDTLIRETQKLFALYSSNDERFLNITKRVRGDELFRFTTDTNKSQLVFDDAELKEWLKSCDDAVLNVIIGELAANIYESLAEKYGERAILESIEKSKNPAIAASLMKKAKDNIMFCIENLLKQQFRFTIQTAIQMAKERSKTKKVTTYLN